MQSYNILLRKKLHISFGATSHETVWDFLKQTCLTRCDISLTRCLNQNFPICLRSKHLQHLFKYQISWNLMKSHFIIMWSPFQPIKSLEILKSCEKMWDFMKKYFHLNSSAVKNKSNRKIFCTCCIFQLLRRCSIIYQPPHIEWDPPGNNGPTSLKLRTRGPLCWLLPLTLEPSAQSGFLQ